MTEKLQADGQNTSDVPESSYDPYDPDLPYDPHNPGMIK